MAIKLVILDADRTLWDHRDVSAMVRPFRLSDRDVLVDSTGNKVRLLRGVRDFLERLKERGLAASIASWNLPGPVMEALQLLALDTYFTNSVVEMHPEKHEMIRKILSKFETQGRPSPANYFT